jgi:uncharacterized phage-associated protein
MNILDARYVADCLVHIASQSPDNNDMTNMKLQKLLYYAQGTYLALHDQKLFEQPIIKWQYGPVIPEVYHQYKAFGDQIIENCEADLSHLEINQLEVIKLVYEYFGQFSAIKLMNLTHSEPPWKSVEINEEITTDLLYGFFKTIVIKDE